MKKMISLLTAICLLLCSLCGAAAEEADVSGVWYLTSLDSDGQLLSPAMIGMEMIYTLNEDGSAALEVNMAGEGASSTGSWSWNGETAVIDVSGAMEARFENDEMYIDEPELGMTLIFSREMEQIPVELESEPRADATLADFEGVWLANRMNVGGSEIQLASVGLGLAVAIEDGFVTMVTTQGEESQAAEQQCELVNGALVLDAESSLQLLENGRLCTSMDLGGVTAVFYFEKVG